MSYDPNHWMEEEPSFDDIIDWEEMRRISEQVPGQSSMFPPDKNFIFRSPEDKINLNNIMEFNDIIYKNPAYTAWELLELHEAAQEMGPESA